MQIKFTRVPGSRYARFGKLEWLSADAAEGCACNKRYDAEDAVDILGKRIGT